MKFKKFLLSVVVLVGVILTFQNCSVDSGEALNLGSVKNNSGSTTGNPTGSTTGSPTGTTTGGTPPAPSITGLSVTCNADTCYDDMFVTNATFCSYPGTTALAGGDASSGIVKFSHGAGNGGPNGFEGYNVLICQGDGGITHGVFRAKCPPNSPASGCVYSGPHFTQIKSAGSAPLLGAITNLGCDSSNPMLCHIRISVVGASKCFYPNTSGRVQQSGGVDATSGSADFSYDGYPNSSTFTGSATLLCVGPSGTSLGRYDAYCAPGPSPAGCVYSGPFQTISY